MKKFLKLIVIILMILALIIQTWCFPKPTAITIELLWLSLLLNFIERSINE